MAMLELHCDVCAKLSPFEQPPCADDHPRAECPDWACTRCGSALYLAPVFMLVDRIAPVVLRRRNAKPSRHAA